MHSTTDRRPKGPLPTYFRARCHEASQGESGGYAGAGYTLITTIARLVPDELENEEWATRLESLESLVLAEDDAGVLGWLDRELPRCMGLVPRARRQQFLKGIYRAVIEDEKDCFSV